MSAPAPGSFDAVATTSLFGAVAGSLSVLFPFFDGLTVALMALLLAAWLGDRARSERPVRAPTPVTLGALATWGAGWVTFLGNLPASAHLNALLLGAAGIPLWWESRTRAPSARGS